MSTGYIMSTGYTMKQFKEDYPYAKFKEFYMGADGLTGKVGVFTDSAGNLGMVFQVF